MHADLSVRLDMVIAAACLECIVIPTVTISWNVDKSDLLLKNREE